MALKKTGLRTGITTGASAAAAARAALLKLYKGVESENVTICNPQGISISVPIARLEDTDGGVRAVVIKDGGDDPDVTHGLEIIADVQPSPSGIVIKGGPGVGTVTRPGLSVAVGEPAINPVPREMIMSAVSPLVLPGQGISVIISVPGGEEVARRTLNPRLGIVGGISILGTSGIVRPMSEEAFKDSLVPLIDMALAHGHKRVVLTPGRLGSRKAVEGYGFPEHAVLEMSNFVGFMLEQCADRGITDVILWGHHGKLVKVAAGIFHTHSRLADGRRETLAAHAALLGASQELVGVILEATTLESVVGVLQQHGLGDIFHHLARRASTRAEEFVHHRLRVGTVMLAMDGRVLGIDDSARDIGREIGCSGL